MKRHMSQSRFAVAMMAVLFVFGTLAETSFAQKNRGGKRGGSAKASGAGGNSARQSGGSSAAAGINSNRGRSFGGTSSAGSPMFRGNQQTHSPSKNQIKNAAKNRVRQNGADRGKEKAKNFAQNHGKDFIRNKAQANGYQKSDVFQNRDAIKNKMKDHVKNNVKDRVVDRVKDSVKSHVKGHIQKHNQWHWHGGNGYNRSTWVQINNRVNYLRHNRHLHWGFAQWKTYYPTRCHWWYNYCGPKFYFDPTCSVSYDWTYYRVPTTVVSQIVNTQVRWYLGMKCTLVPGRGLGVEYVEAGSPADLAGLTPGMFIVAANGIVIDSEASFPIAIDQSGGQLGLEVLISETAEVARVDVTLEQVRVSNY